MTELEKILEPLKGYDYQILEDISSDLISVWKLCPQYKRAREKKAAGEMLRLAVMYLIKEDLKVR